MPEQIRQQVQSNCRMLSRKSKLGGTRSVRSTRDHRTSQLRQSEVACPRACAAKQTRCARQRQAARRWLIRIGGRCPRMAASRGAYRCEADPYLSVRRHGRVAFPGADSGELRAHSRRNPGINGCRQGGLVKDNMRSTGNAQTVPSASGWSSMPWVKRWTGSTSRLWKPTAWRRMLELAGSGINGGSDHSSRLLPLLMRTGGANSHLRRGAGRFLADCRIFPIYQRHTVLRPRGSGSSFAEASSLLAELAGVIAKQDQWARGQAWSQPGARTWG